MMIGRDRVIKYKKLVSERATVRVALRSINIYTGHY